MIIVTILLPIVASPAIVSLLPPPGATILSTVDTFEIQFDYEVTTFSQHFVVLGKKGFEFCETFLAKLICQLFGWFYICMKTTKPQEAFNFCISFYKNFP